MNNNVLAQVAALPKMGAAELKKMWKEIYLTDPPPFNKPYYVKRLAYRIQEVAFGVEALTRLMKDTEDGKVDVVVVYKIDRLTRSLTDFSKLIEVFDRRNVSFVSVTYSL